MCTHRLWGDPDGMRCTRDDHDDRGHVYHADAGSDLAAEASTGDEA